MKKVITLISYFIISMEKGLKFHLLFLFCLLALDNFLKAQNISYNANSIPVNTGMYNAIFGGGNFYLHNTSIGSFNTALGITALSNNIEGRSNTATGAETLYSNTYGFNNTANGVDALFYNSTGYSNTAIGEGALLNNTTGNNNIAIGVETLRLSITGYHNIAIGNAGLYNNSGNLNIAIGDSAGYHSLGNGNVFIGTRVGFRETGSNKMYIGNDSTKNLLYGDFSTGQVLIGKGNPNGYVFKGTRTLNVLGGVLADSVRIALSGTWADNVFNKDYQLKSLNELEQYISINKHLPDVPTTREVKSNGINVADMEAKLLKKIEELTLYVIELKKESEQQQEEIKKLKRKMK